jgi:hypothetical protein
MHPLIAYDLAKIKIADLHAEADRERLAATARSTRQQTERPSLIPARWTLRRFFARLHLAGSGA